MTEPGRQTDRTQWLAALVGLVGVFVLWEYSRRYGTLPVLPGLEILGTLEPEKMLGALGAISLVALLDLGAWAIGERLLRALPVVRDEVTGLRFLVALALGLLVVSTIVLVLAMIGILGSRTLAALLVLPALAGVWMLRGVAWRRPRWGSRHWTVAGVAALLIGTFVGALSGDVGFDALTYHLAIPERYLFHGGVWVSPMSQFSVFPAATDMLYVPSLALADERAATLIHFQFGALTLAGLAVVGARRSRRCATLAPLVLLAEPLLHREMTWAYNDLASAFFGLLAVDAAATWIRSEDRGALVRAGLLAGGCMATRYTGGAVLLAICVAIWLPPRHRRIRANGVACVWLGGLATLVLFPWLLRNLLWTGNPIAPFLQDIFYSNGAEFFDPVASHQKMVWDFAIGVERSLGFLLRLPWTVTMESVPGSYRESFGYPISPLYLWLVPITLVLSAWRRRCDVAFELTAAGVLVVLWFFTVQESRYLLPALPLLALAGARGLDLLLPQPGRRWLSPRQMLLAPLAFAIALALVPGLNALPERWSRAFGETPLEPELPVVRAARAIREEPGPKGRIALLFDSRSFYYRGLDYVPYQPMEAPPLLHWFHARPSVDELHCGLQAMGVTHVLVNSNLRHKSWPAWTEEYGPEDHWADLNRMQQLLTTRARLVLDQQGIAVGALIPATDCPDRDDES